MVNRPQGRDAHTPRLPHRISDPADRQSHTTQRRIGAPTVPGYGPTSSAVDPTYPHRAVPNRNQQTLLRSLAQPPPDGGTDIRGWIDTWNENPRPYIWTTTADQFLQSIATYCGRISDHDTSSERADARHSSEKRSTRPWSNHPLPEPRPTSHRPSLRHQLQLLRRVDALGEVLRHWLRADRLLVRAAQRWHEQIDVAGGEGGRPSASNDVG
jgi:hypothetical protein